MKHGLGHRVPTLVDDARPNIVDSVQIVLELSFLCLYPCFISVNQWLKNS